MMNIFLRPGGFEVWLLMLFFVWSGFMVDGIWWRLRLEFGISGLCLLVVRIGFGCGEVIGFGSQDWFWLWWGWFWLWWLLDFVASWCSLRKCRLSVAFDRFSFLSCLVISSFSYAELWVYFLFSLTCYAAPSTELIPFCVVYFVLYLVNCYLAPPELSMLNCAFLDLYLCCLWTV